MPTTEEIEQAKEYLRKRLEAENSMRANLEKYMQEAARRLVDIAYKRNIPPAMFRFSYDIWLEREVKEVIGWLKDQIDDAVCTLAIAGGEGDAHEIILYVFDENHSKTFRQRENVYANRFKYEVEAAIAAGLILGVAKEELKKSMEVNIRSPYSNPYFVEALGSRTAAVRLKEKGVTYGTGRSNVAFNLLDRLSVNAVSQGWMRHWQNMHPSASGFYSYRGSSYPCSLCDSMVGWHPIADYAGGWHLNCKCFFVFT